MTGIETLILFDDERAAAWQPFTSTRPAGELVFGTYTFRARAEVVFGAPCAGHIAPGLTGFDEPGSAPVVDAGAIDPSRSRLYLSSRAVAAWDTTFDPPAGPGPVLIGDAVAGWFAPAGEASPSAAFLQQPAGAETAVEPAIRLPGIVLEDFWELVTRHGRQLEQDVARAVRERPSVLPGHVECASDPAGRIRVGAHVTFEPGVVVDCSGGPVWLDDGVAVRAFTRLSGPLYAGPGSTLLGGSLAEVSIGPVCKVRGEFESSVMLGYSNKAHDGYIGHAYVGRWVNLGALTTNSDLKNNYGAVRVATPHGDRDTGSIKVGCFLGDHVKTAIGTLLNTGTVVGAGANLFGSRMPGKRVRPFAWGNDGDEIHALNRFLETARIAMSRRGVTLTPGVRDVLEAAWRNAAGVAP